METNHEERLFRKLVPTFYPGDAVGKQILGTCGKGLATVLDLPLKNITYGTAGEEQQRY